MLTPKPPSRPWPAAAQRTARRGLVLVGLPLLGLVLLLAWGLAGATEGAGPQVDASTSASAGPVLAPWLAGLAALNPADWADQLQARQAQSPVGFGLGFFLLFTLLSALALPGCGPLALAAGLCFGAWAGTLVVTLASTLGATLSFLAARHWARDAVQRRWGHRLAPLEERLARDGGLALFSLRVAPVIPYAALNPLMGLTAMSTRRFAAISALGMLAGSAAYAVVGAELGRSARLADLASPALLAGLAVLAGLPWMVRWMLRRWSAR